VIMMSALICDVIPYSLVEVHWYSRGMYCLHLQSWRGSQAAHAFCHSFLLDICLPLQPWNWRQYTPLKHMWISTSLQSILYQ
jgi:hypothetical protein